MKRIVLTFGLISGAILSLMMAVTLPFHDQIGFEYGMVIGYASMVAAFLLIYFGVRTYRDSVAGGVVSFGRAFQIGMLIACVASACYVVTWEFIYPRIGDQYAASHKAQELAKARAAGASQAEIDAKTAEIDRNWKLYENIAIRVPITFFEPLPPALIIALVSAAILRRRRQPNVSPSAEPLHSFSS
jgi:hypothetical protein